MKKFFLLVLIFFPIESPVGLANLGNTCYINSTLQSLLACDSFVKFMTDENFERDSVGDELKELMLKHIVEKQAIRPTGFIECISKNTLMGKLAIKSQQDAADFLNNLINKLSATVPEVQYLFYLTIKNCAIWNSTLTNCNDDSGIILNLPTVFNKDTTLDERLFEFFKKPSDNKNFYNQNFLTIAPPILVIQPNRVFADKGKNKGIISYNLHPLSFNVKGKDYTYTIKGIVLHSGEFNSGHYTALVCKDAIWYRCDDDQIQQLTQEEVINRLNNKHQQSYLFFFERQETLQAKEITLFNPSVLNNLFTEFKQQVTGLYVQALAL